jgi:hypothetical protein
MAANKRGSQRRDRVSIAAGRYRPGVAPLVVGQMRLPRRKWIFVAGGSLVLAGLAGICAWLLRAPPEPEYSGKRLSVWAEELCQLNHLRNVIDTNCAAVRAVLAIGTNAIPWAARELVRPPPLGWRLNNLLQKQRFIRSRFAVATDFERHHLRARAVFWALGNAAEPAIPRLLSMVEREPDLGPSALAGIGAPALPALAHCLTNIPPAATSRDHARMVASALGGLYIAIDVGRISRSEASYLLPTVREWQTNRETRYWADGVLREFIGEH